MPKNPNESPIPDNVIEADELEAHIAFPGSPLDEQMTLARQQKEGVHQENLKKILADNEREHLR
jgi:hypothetical protein